MSVSVSMQRRGGARTMTTDGTAPMSAPAADSSERRRGDRLPVEKRPRLTATSGGRSYDCQVLDVSVHGMRLRFPDAVPDGNVIALDHPVAGTICGRCVWRNGEELGVELLVPSTDLERILRCVYLVI